MLMMGGRAKQAGITVTVGVEPRLDGDESGRHVSSENGEIPARPTSERTI